MVAEALVGVEAAAWLRAWAGMSIEAKEGLLDNSGVKKHSKKKVIRSCLYRVCPGWTEDGGHSTSADSRHQLEVTYDVN